MPVFSCSFAFLHFPGAGFRTDFFCLSGLLKKMIKAPVSSQTQNPNKRHDVHQFGFFACMLARVKDGDANKNAPAEAGAP